MVAVIIVAGVVWFALTVARLHFIRPDVDAHRRGLSRYAAGPNGRLISTAFVSLATSCGAAGYLLSNPGNSPGLHRASALLFMATFGLILVILFPLRSARPIQIEYVAHQLGGAIFFCSAAAGSLAAGTSESHLTAATRQVVLVSGAGSSVALTLFMMSIAWKRSPLQSMAGLFQRLLFFSICVSLVALGWRSLWIR